MKQLWSSFQVWNLVQSSWCYVIWKFRINDHALMPERKQVKSYMGLHTQFILNMRQRTEEWSVSSSPLQSFLISLRIGSSPASSQRPCCCKGSWRNSSFRTCKIIHRSRNQDAVWLLCLLINLLQLVVSNWKSQHHATSILNQLYVLIKVEYGVTSQIGDDVGWVDLSLGSSLITGL